VAISWTGGTPVRIDEGNSPTVSKQGRIAYGRGGEMWMESFKGEGKPNRIVAHGKNYPVKWSPDGTKLLFLSDRGDHSFIGIYDVNAEAVKFLAATVDSDSDPSWSLDGKEVPSCASQRFRAIRRRVISLSLIGRILGPSGLRMWIAAAHARFGIAEVHCKIRFRTWREIRAGEC